PGDVENPLEIVEFGDDEEPEFTTEVIPVIAQIAIAAVSGINFVHSVHGLCRSNKLAIRFTPEHTLVTGVDEDILLNPIKGTFDDDFYLQTEKTLVENTPFEKLLKLSLAA